MINPSFTRGEYWILAAVAEHPVATFWLLHERLEEALNRRGHGISRPLFILTMKKLISEGLVEIFHESAGVVPHDVTIERIEEYFPRDKPRSGDWYSYRLTPKGGHYWELFASPCWEFYITNRLSYPDDDSNVGLFELVGAQEKYIELCYKSLVYHEWDVIEDSIQKSILKPWQATYWKELPVGNKLTFRCRYKEDDSDFIVPEKNHMFRYKRIWCNWR